MQQDQQNQVAPSKKVRGKTTVGGSVSVQAYKDLIGDPAQDPHSC